MKNTIGVVVNCLMGMGHDKSFSNVVARWATIEPYLVARPKK